MVDYRPNGDPRNYGEIDSSLSNLALKINSQNDANISVINRALVEVSKKTELQDIVSEAQVAMQALYQITNNLDANLVYISGQICVDQIKKVVDILQKILQFIFLQSNVPIDILNVKTGVMSAFILLNNASIKAINVEEMMNAFRQKYPATVPHDEGPVSYSSDIQILKRNLLVDVSSANQSIAEVNKYLNPTSQSRGGAQSTLKPKPQVSKASMIALIKRNIAKANLSTHMRAKVTNQDGSVSTSRLNAMKREELNRFIKKLGF